MSKIIKWAKDMEPIRRLSFFFIFMLIITYFVFFVFIGGYGYSLNYENAYLSFLSLIVSTGLTSIYNLLTRKERWRPKSVEEDDLKEKTKDNMNITTVAVNIFYILVVYLNNSGLDDYITHISPEILMTIISSIISMWGLTMTVNTQKKMKQKKLMDIIDGLDIDKAELDIIMEILREKKENKRDNDNI